MSVSTSTQAPPRFVHWYIRAMLFSTNDESAESGGYPLDENYGVADIAPETMERIVDDCNRFYDAVERAGIDLDSALIDQDDCPLENAGKDFWFTRCGHGCGFWDGDWSDEVEGKLTELAKSFGEQWPYVGDDGMIYL